MVRPVDILWLLSNCPVLLINERGRRGGGDTRDRVERSRRGKTAFSEEEKKSEEV